MPPSTKVQKRLTVLPDKPDSQQQASFQGSVPTRSQAPDDEALEDLAQAPIDKPADCAPPIMHIQPLSGLSAPASLVRRRDPDSADNTRQKTKIKTKHSCLVCNQTYTNSYQNHWRRVHLTDLLHVKALEHNQIHVCGYCECDDLYLGQSIIFQTPDALAVHVWKDHKQHPLPIWLFNNILRNLISGVPIFRQLFMETLQVSNNPILSWPEEHISDIEWGIVAELSALGAKTKPWCLDQADYQKARVLFWRTQFPTMIIPAAITNHGYLGAISPAQTQFYYPQVSNSRHSYTPTPPMPWNNDTQPDVSNLYPQENWPQYDTSIPTLPSSQSLVSPRATPKPYNSNLSALPPS